MGLQQIKRQESWFSQGVTKSQQKLICNSIYVCCLAKSLPGRRVLETKIFTTQLVSSSRWKEATEGLILSLLFLLFPASLLKFTLASISRALLYFIRPNSLLLRSLDEMNEKLTRTFVNIAKLCLSSVFENLSKCLILQLCERSELKTGKFW